MTIQRFIEVTKDLFRGSAPSIEDVVLLNKDYNIKKIVSLDENAGNKIDRICKILGINHIMMPIYGTDFEALSKLLSCDLKELLIDDGPTFVHCIHGKDRTGMVIAMFKCKYLGWPYDQAIKEAESLGFGVGLPTHITNIYKKIVHNYCKQSNFSHTNDNNDASITDNVREEQIDRDVSMPSFAPYLDRQPKQDPLYENAPGLQGLEKVQDGMGFVVAQEKMIKKVYATQLSYEVSNAEKAQAEKALMIFEHALTLLKVSSDHLNIMYLPFKNNPDISTEQIIKYRAALRRFRDKSVENFNNFKIMSFKSITLMQLFSSDTQTIKILKSFISLVDDIEKQVNNFVRLFDKLESKTFVDDITKNIDKVQKKCKELEDIIDERIKGHLQTNILGKTWIDGISNELQMKIEEQTPLLINLHKERQKQLNSKK